jgi:DNA-binding transcriptional regulator/RsmH inhibitor MraZ
MNEPDLPLILTAEQKRSSLWIILMKHWEKRLDNLRKSNDGNKDERETAYLRGLIAETKTNMALNQEPRNIV